jgi:hypothetical protein
MTRPSWSESAAAVPSYGPDEHAAEKRLLRVTLGKAAQRVGVRGGCERMR